ncbi:MAG: UDP-3-O-acyl-N-acetylglucosamine deacetylase [Firmicutes bacterium]|nr:UDP-3-O-acyl-N-acetylglucosamine deacetylase [Bacillota bacterium]
MVYQTTIARPVEIAGIGLHTAVPARLRLVPAPAGTGIVFRRTDLDDFQIEARAENVARVSYATSLMKRGVLISTTEHLLAALYACGIDNIIVELDAIEVPILDGSSQPFIELLARAGLRRLRRRRRYLQVLRPLEVAEDGRRICIAPAETFSIRCFIDFPHPRIGAQQVELCVHRESFARELAPARTFGFLDDVERLRALGLIRGGSLQNAIVLTRDGILNDGLRFPDEFVRHKALDLIGDLALLGWPLLGRVEAHKAGHALHVALVSRLLADRSLWKLTTADEREDTVRRTGHRGRHALPAAP